MQKSCEQSKKTSRAKHHCPKLLSEMIELANLVPPETVLPDWKKVFDAQAKHLPEQSEEQSQEKFAVKCEQTFNECFKFFSDELKEKLFNERASRHFARNPDKSRKALAAEIHFHILVVWYEEMRQVREDLKAVVAYFSNWRKEGFISVGEKGLYDRDGKYLMMPEIKVSFQIIDTIIKVKPMGLAEAIDGVDGDRIRACDVCNRIFWAKRKDSETCSTTCFNTLRQRRHREKNKQLINSKRRENYKYKKERKNKNGTL